MQTNRRSREETDSDPESAPLHPALRHVRCGNEEDLEHSDEAQKRWAQAEKYAADLRKASSASPPKMRAKFTSRCFKMLVVSPSFRLCSVTSTQVGFPDEGNSELCWGSRRMLVERAQRQNLIIDLLSLPCFSGASSPICVSQAGAPGTGKTTFIQNLASAYGSQDDGASLGL